MIALALFLFLVSLIGTNAETRRARDIWFIVGAAILYKVAFLLKVLPIHI